MRRQDLGGLLVRDFWFDLRIVKRVHAALLLRQTTADPSGARGTRCFTPSFLRLLQRATRLLRSARRSGLSRCILDDPSTDDARPERPVLAPDATQPAR